MDGGRVGRSWCMRVVGRWFGGGRDGGGGRYACRMKPAGWSHVGRCRSTSKMRADTLMTTLSRCGSLGSVEPELVGLQGKALTRDAMLLSMQPVGYTLFYTLCYTLYTLCYSMVLHGLVDV